MKKLITATALLAVAVSISPAPAFGWVAVGGYRGGVAVGYRPPCCYGGAAVASSAYAAAQPVYYAAPVAYAPPVGTVVAALPPGCSSMSVNGTSYMNCGGVWYLPFYSGGALMYQVSTP